MRLVRSEYLVRQIGFEPTTLSSVGLLHSNFSGVLGNYACSEHHFLYVRGKILVRFIIG
jgi:hypothetical protein